MSFKDFHGTACTACADQPYLLLENQIAASAASWSPSASPFASPDAHPSAGQRSLVSPDLPHTPASEREQASDYQSLEPSPKHAQHAQPDMECKYCAPHVGSSSLRSAGSNLVLAVLGAGQLTLPYALSQLGLGFGVAALFVFMGLSVHSCYTLSVHALHFQPSRKYCLDSYSELVVRVLGRAGEWTCTSMIAMYAWGGAVGFLVILKGELAFLAALLGLPGQLLHVDTGITLMVLMSAAVMWPLGSKYDLSSLKVFSPFACLAAIYIMVVVSLCLPFRSLEPCRGPETGEQDGAGALKWLPDSVLDVARALPLIAFAMNSSWAIIPVLCTLRHKTERRTWKLILSSYSVIVTNYVLISVCGYFMFCNHTNPNILEALGEYVNPDSWQGVLLISARAALAFQLTIGVPMRFFIVRRSVGGGELSCVPRACLTGVIALPAVALASLPLSVAFVLGVVSSICASMIIYILPAVIDLRTNLKGRKRKACSVVGLVVGLFVMVGGLVANFAGSAKGS